jgi:hypothetical protein
MSFSPGKDDCFGLARAAPDAHTLGIASIEQILKDAGYRAVTADTATCEAFGTPESPRSQAAVERWLDRNRITVLGFSYRLDPASGAAFFSHWVHNLKAKGLLAAQGGRIRGLFFAGLPEACKLVKERIPEVAGAFCGDETPSEALRALGIDPRTLPEEIAGGVSYDEDRLSFGKDVVAKGEYLSIQPVPRGGYAEFGTARDTLAARLGHRAGHGLLPVVRAHVGPYLPDRQEAVKQFLDYCRQLAGTGFLNVLSIGTSQLTQSDFGQDWGDKPNGGGVPLNSEEEFAAVWRASRPMLVRSYAGTRNIPQLARMYDRTINNAWHALSLWWFCRIDGRGPYSVKENLQQHIETLRYVASTGKPFEPNVPHHFAFRGADDVTHVVSAVLAARLAKSLGVRCLVLQNMLNTPKHTWGVQDLAKSRATLTLARELEDDRFKVIWQPRGGLDYFSHDLDKAKAQLAAVTALMDDVEPGDSGSPPLIHVVSYSEGSHLADPAVVDESIKITRHALAEYRRLRARGQVDDMSKHPEVKTRTHELLSEARAVLEAVEAAIPDLYTASGFYQTFARGFLPVPYLWHCREEFAQAVRWPTRVVRGSVKVVNQKGMPIPVGERIQQTCSQIGLEVPESK